MCDEVKKFSIHINLTVVQAMQKIDSGARGIVYVVDDSDCLIGCVTDGDIRRWLIKTADLTATVDRFMSQSPKFLYENESNESQAHMNKYSINSIPVVDENKRIVKILFREFSSKENKSKKNNRLKNVPVVIMAGGKGTRLYPYTMVMPKPLIPVGGTTIIERIINRFIDTGVETFYLSVNYKKSMIKAYFEETNLDCKIEYIEEDKPLGTGGSIKLIEGKLDRAFVVTNCDTLIDADISDVYEQHLKSGNPITVVAALKNFTVPYGVLKVKEDCILDELQEKPTLSYFINTGMYIVNSELLDFVPDNTIYHMTDLVRDCMDKGLRVGIYPISEEAFLDMGEFKEMKRMEEKLQ